MKVLFDAVYNKFIADGKYGLTALYNTEADSEAVYPYAVMSLVSAVPEWTFTEDGENCILQFNLFDDDPKSTDINAAFTALDAKFHKKTLTIDGIGSTSMTREVANLFKIEKRWQYNISYRIEFQVN